MAKLKGKGTVLETEVAAVFTAVSQLTDIGLPDMESGTMETDTLDNAGSGVPYDPTGTTEGGTLTANGFFDPALTIHKNLLALLTTPAKRNYKLKFADGGTTTWAFAGAGLKIGGAIGIREGTKFNLAIKLDGIPTFPA
jgi:hypothetical protein